MKVISFLGTTNYSPTKYRWNETTYQTNFFPAAVAYFFQPQLHLICATPQVKRHDNLPELEDELAKLGVSHEVISIPDGRSEEELWEIFDILTDSVEMNDTVIFDVTHSFRSLPFLVFLAVAYLKAAKNVHVDRVLYGAWEARDEANISPIFDLTPFVALLDWLSASDEFINTGNARRLARLLNPTGSTSGKAVEAANSLWLVSQAAVLCQPFTLMGQVGNLDRQLEEAGIELQQTAHPFAVLRERIATTFLPIAADYPQDERAGLAAELYLVKWYTANRQYVQAMTLAREWLVDLVAWRLRQPVDFRGEVRSPLERALSGIGRVGRRFFDEQTGTDREFTVADLNEYGRRIYDEWPERDELKKLWEQLTQLRNKFNHAEHQPGAFQARPKTKIRAIEKVRRQTEEIVEQLMALAEAWGVEQRP